MLTLKRGAKITDPTLENWWAAKVAGNILFLVINVGILSMEDAREAKNLQWKCHIWSLQRAETTYKSNKIISGKMFQNMHPIANPILVFLFILLPMDIVEKNNSFNEIIIQKGAWSGQSLKNVLGVGSTLRVLWQ